MCKTKLKKRGPVGSEKGRPGHIRGLLFFCLILFCGIGVSEGSGDEAGQIGVWQLMDQERYMYPSDSEMERLNGWEIRKRRDDYRTAGQSPKRFKLGGIGKEDPGSVGSDLLATGNLFSRDWKLSAVTAVIVRDPDGEITPLEARPVITIPEDFNLIGRYLLGASLVLEPQDMDHDGTLENVYLHAKYIISHYKNGGRVGRASVVFFDDEERLPLEIGPVINTAKSRFGGGMQSPHRFYDMMVKYRGEPLAHARVFVMAQGSDWQKTVVTDSAGKFTIMPTDDRVSDLGWQNYIYIATHHDKANNAYHLATLPIPIRKNRPEWRSRAMGFTYWTIAGTAMLVLTILGFAGRKRRENAHTLVVFENRAIHSQEKKEPPV